MIHPKMIKAQIMTSSLLKELFLLSLLKLTISAIFVLGTFKKLDI